MKTPKVTATIARALAELAVERIKTAKDKLEDHSTESALRSNELKQIRALVKEQRKLATRIDKIRTAAQNKFKVSINVYHDNSIRVAAQRDRTVPSIDLLKNEIIIASHVHGLDSDKL